MLNERVLRTALFVIVAALHALAIFFLAFTVSAKAPRPPENARVMKLFDLAEAPPPPPPPARLSPPPRAQEVPRLESIAETMIETDPPPEQAPAAAGTLAVPGEAPAVAAADDYLPMHMLSQPPRFDEKRIAADLVYPEIARRSGVEGRVILELVVDRHGVVQQALILQENPPGRGFGEAAVKAFIGKKGSPAMANGQEVSTRYRYPVSFRIK
jgi:protein TonB